MQTVLIIEDERSVRYALKEFLEMEGYCVMEASLGSRSLQILETHPVDAVLLDLCLPDVHGLDLITCIRDQTDIPLLIMSGSDDVNGKVRGFELGADDYLTKPFNMLELKARLKAHITRYDTFKSFNDNALCNSQNDHLSALGSWVLDEMRYDAFTGSGRAAELTITEFRLLQALVNRAGQPVDRDELCKAVRMENYCPTPRAIDIKITRMRKKMGDDGQHPQLIKTVRGVGYMIDAVTLTTEIMENVESLEAWS